MATEDDTPAQPLSVTVVPVTPFQQNASILVCARTGDAAVVDPGGDVERIEAALKETGGTCRQILLTHGHIDHAGGAAKLAGRLSVPVVGPHEEDRLLLETLVQSGMSVGIEDAEAVEPDRWLREGETVSVGEISFEVRQVPGHTPGHILFYAPDLSFVIGGDALFQGSIGRTDFPYGDHDRLIASIREKMLTMPDHVTVLPGHGPATTIGAERAGNPFLAGG